MATDSSTLGAYQINSTDESVPVQGVNTHALAKTALNALYSADADYKLSGTFGTYTASVDAGADARDAAASFNLISGDTGVSATALTKARMSASAAGTFTFTLEGKSTTLSTVTATITQITDLTAIKDAINAVSGSTGITSALTSDKAGINLTQEEGFDIIIGDVSTGTTNADLHIQSMNMDDVLDTGTAAICNTTSGVVGSATSAVIVAGADHGFEIGDIVTYTAAATAMDGLTSGSTYRVNTVPSTTTFTITNTLSAAMTYGGGNGNAADTFTRGARALDGNATTNDSIAINGSIRLSSQGAYTLTPGNAANHFNADTTELTSNLYTVGTVSLSTKSGAMAAMSIIDAAMQMISGIRSDMGAADNRLKSTVDNLSNIAVNTQASLSSIEDADFAEETAKLTKAQILSQAATAMLAQANAAKQNALDLVK